MATALLANLTAAQAQVALSLASGASLTSSAEAAGVGRTTIYDWLTSLPEFSAAVEQAKADYVLTLRDQLRDASVKALATITALLDDPNAPPAVRLKAALAILNRPHFPDPGWHLPEKVGPPQQEQLTEQLAFLKADLRCFEQEIAANRAARLEREAARTEPDISEHQIQNPQSESSPQPSTSTNPNTSEHKIQVSEPQQPVRTNKTGRNEPRPCGSGKKFKRCCLGKTESAATSCAAL